MTLPKDFSHLNLTNEEYMALSNVDKEILFDKLRKNVWVCFSEANPNFAKPKLPCVIDGVIVGE